MVSLSTKVARRRVFYPRPILAMPDILMIDIPAELREPSLLLGRYCPILVETAAEQRELEAYLEEEHEQPCPPDPFASRPSTLPNDHITVAHYGPPVEGWPYVILCRWPPDLTTAAEFLKAGAVCLGVGGQLVDPKAVAARDFARLTALAKQYVEIVRQTRG